MTTTAKAINEKLIWQKTEQALQQLAQQKPLSEFEQMQRIKEIKQLLQEKNAVLVAHYYVDAQLQALAEETGGFVGDSLEMARFGKQHPADTLIVAGVRFMGETAKILSPEKTILVVDQDAECSLDLSCPIDEFSSFCDQHPDRTVVVYANTSAKVKARADWVVTSSIAVDVVKHLHSQGQKILWGPDKHLGAYIQQQTGADMILWNGSCIVHDAFKANALKDLMDRNPEAAVLVHPESPQDVIALADVVGSTTGLIKAAKSLPNKTMIVATDMGIFYKMKQAAPQKTFIEAPNAGFGATCESCAHCPWMAMNTLDKVINVLKDGGTEVEINEGIRKQAAIATQRMVDFGEQKKQQTVTSGS